MGDKKTAKRVLWMARQTARQSAAQGLLERCDAAGGELLKLPSGGELRERPTAMGMIVWCPDIEAASAAVAWAEAVVAEVEREYAALAEQVGYRNWRIRFVARAIQAGVVDLSFTEAHRVVTVRRDAAEKPKWLSDGDAQSAREALDEVPRARALKMRATSGVARRATWFDPVEEHRSGANVGDALVVAWDRKPEVRLAGTRKERPKAPDGEFSIGRWECTYIYR